MANINNLTAAGLHTFPNYLSNVPQGALVKADNVVIDRDGVIEPARGFTQYANIGISTDRAKQLLDYKTRLLVHYDDVLSVDNATGGTFLDLKDTYTEVSSGLRIKYLEFNGNLYLTTSEGIKKIATRSDNPFPTINEVEEGFAGGIKASDITATPNYTTTGFLPAYSKVSYRVIWLIKDINSNLIIGYPSARFEVVNPFNQSCTVDINVPIPQDVIDAAADIPTKSYFFQIYRSNIAESATPKSLENLSLISSDDEMRLVYEAYPSSSELSLGYCNINDVTSQDYRNGGANLYTNETSGSGIAQANFRPPLAEDISLYKNYTFFGNTKTYHNLALALTGTANMVELGISSISYSSGQTTIITSTAHNLSVGSYIVIKGLNPISPYTHPLNGTWQTIAGTTDNTIKIITSDWTASPAVPSDGAVYTSSIIIGKGALPEERYFFVGRQGKVKATFPASIPTASSYFKFKSMENKQEYALWYERITPAVKEVTTVTCAGDGTPSFISDKGATFTSGSSNVSITGHGLSVGDYIIFKSITGPTNITINTKYYVKTVVNVDQFEISLSSSSATIVINNNGTGTAISTLGTKYFYLRTVDNKLYHIWYAVGDQTTDPLLGSSASSGIRVTIIPYSTPAEVADATVTALQTISNDFTISYTPLSSSFQITNTIGGDVNSVDLSFITTFSKVVNTNGVDEVITGTEPTLPLDIIKIKTSINDTDTVAQVIEKTTAAISMSTYDFDLVSDASSITFKTVLSGFLDVASFIDSSTGIIFSMDQEGYGEDISNKYVRWIALTEESSISPSTALDDSARSLIRIINSESNIIDAAYSSTSNDIPGKMFLEALSLDDAPFFVLANSDTNGSNFSPSIADAVDSSNEVSPNRIYYSKLNEPEHVPRLNYIDIGPKDKKIIRIIGLQDSLFIFKEEGIYRLIGEDPTNFNIKLHDSSGILIAPDSPTVLNNQIYCFTTQGIVAVSEAGMSIISRPIENIILKASENANFKTMTFGLSSESDRSLLMFTAYNINDQVATVAYRYNVFTKAWTTIVKSATCGVLNKETNKFFLGADDLNLVEQERKSLSRRDFAGRQYTKDFISNSKIGNTIKLSSTENVEVGDIIVQTQYLTISQVNRLLRQLDADITLKHPIDSNYFSSLEMSFGDDLNTTLTNLVVKLNSRDTTKTYIYTSSTDFSTIQSNFNTQIIAELNTSNGVFYTNYSISTGTTIYELRVDNVAFSGNIITSNEFLPIVAGQCIVHKNIPVDVVWSPQYFGEANTLKHVRESTLMFEDTSFIGGQLGFNTDLSANFEGITFNMTGDGLWGQDKYDSNPWGGAGMAVPFRTYIPKQKQRCRFIRSRFQNKGAFTKFAILGISYVFETSSERAYK